MKLCEAKAQCLIIKVKLRKLKKRRLEIINIINIIFEKQTRTKIDYAKYRELKEEKKQILEVERALKNKIDLLHINLEK